jgi:hypothetical protein
MKLVGIVVFNDEVVLDDVDRYPAYVLFTPALTRPFSTGPEGVAYGLRLTAGARGVPAVEQEIIRALPKGTTYSFHVTSVVQGQVNRTVRPEAIALALFRAIAMLAALLIPAQAIARQLQETDQDVAVLRALGASRSVIAGDGLFGILGAVVVGSLVAAGVAIVLSPLSPIGPVRPVYPTPGLAVDATVLGLGLLALIAGLGAVAVALAARLASGPCHREAAPRATRGSSLARLAARSGAPATRLVRGLAVDGRRRGGCRGRNPGGRGIRAVALDRIRSPDLCRTRCHGAGASHRLRRPRRARARQPHRCPSRDNRISHPGGPRPAIGVTGQPWIGTSPAGPGGSGPLDLHGPKAREPCGHDRPHRRPGLQPPIGAGLVVVEPDKTEHVRLLSHPGDQVLRGRNRVRAGLHRGLGHDERLGGKASDLLHGRPVQAAEGVRAAGSEQPVTPTQSTYASPR